MGPKRRLSVAERLQRANAASAPKKRSINCNSGRQSPAYRKSNTASASSSGGILKSSATKEAYKGNSPVKKSCNKKPEESLEGAKIKEKFEEKKASKTSSRECAKKCTNEKDDRPQTQGTATSGRTKDDMKKLDCDNKEKEENISSSSSTTSSSSKLQDKKDDKNRAISKMLKSLDIKISGFDNLLPKEQNIQELRLKSSISENVKTKSRAAAVKVIASLSTPKPVKRAKNPEAEERRKTVQKQNENCKETAASTDQKKNIEKPNNNKTKQHDKATKPKTIERLSLSSESEKMVKQLGLEKEKKEEVREVVQNEDMEKKKEKEKILEEITLIETKKKIAAKKARMDQLLKSKKPSANKLKSNCDSKEEEEKQKDLKEVTKEADENVKGAHTKEQLSREIPVAITTKEDFAKEHPKLQANLSVSEKIGETLEEAVAHTKKKSPKHKMSKLDADDLLETKCKDKPEDKSIQDDKEEENAKKKQGQCAANANEKLIKQSQKVSTPQKLIQSKLDNDLKCNNSEEMYDEKEEILKVVIDSNTEVVQMEIEEISTSKVKSKTHKNTEEDANIGNSLEVEKEPKNELCKEGNLEEVQISKEKEVEAKNFPLHIKAPTSKISNIKQRFQTKFKVNPIKAVSPKPVNKMNLNKVSLNKSSPFNQKKQSPINDVYDFKSGSEEEEFIKMDLPTLKNLRELSEEDEEKKPALKNELCTKREKLKNEDIQIDTQKDKEKDIAKEETVKSLYSKEKLKKIEQKNISSQQESPKKESNAKETPTKINKTKQETPKKDKPQLELRELKEIEESSEEKSYSDTIEEDQSQKKSITKSVKLSKKPLKANQNIKTIKKKPIKQISKVSKAVKSKMAKKNEKVKYKSNKTQTSSSEESTDSEDEKNLIVFSQKRHRMASLNALAKVQCLYENESRTAYELGLSKATLLPPKIRTVDNSDDEKQHQEKKKDKDTERDKEKEKEKVKDVSNKTEEKTKTKKDKKLEDPLKIEESNREESEEEVPEEPKRELRNVPGGRGIGKHWEFDSDCELDEIDILRIKKKKLQKKLQAKKEKEEKLQLLKDKREMESKAHNIKDDNKNKEPIKVKRKYTKIKKPLKKVVKLVTGSSEDEGNSESSDKEEHHEKDKDKLQKLKMTESKKPPKKRKRILKEELIGDYKGILARKRMASLNASAIVAATYEVERHLDRNLSGYETYDDEQKTSSKKTKETKVSTKETKSKTATVTATATATSGTSVLPASTDATTSSPTVTAYSSSMATSITNAPASSSTKEVIHDPPDKLAATTESKTITSNTSLKVDKPVNICEESNDSKYSKETKETNTDTTTTTTTSSSLGSSSATNSTKDGKDSSRPTSSSVVIVQDTDVTITGVYVNSTTGSSQESYCKMQYRVQSSVTEERLVRPGSTEPPPKSYTPLSALSSMLPPGASTSNVSGEGHTTVTPPPAPAVNTTQTSAGATLSETLNAAAGLYNPADLGIHTEQGPVEHHPPPPPSYAAAAAAAAAAYHAHHIPPHGAGHHQHQYGHSHIHHQYQQSAADHHGMPPPPHHYGNSGPPPSHYGPPPVGHCDTGSPPPTYRASNTYGSNIPGMPAQPAALPSAMGSGGAFCPTNVHLQQQQHSAQAASQQQQSAAQASANEASGYYQPAGPLISHVLPPVSAGPPIPPNVPLLAATATKIKSQTPTAANTVDSNEHIPGAGQTNPTTTEPPDADLLITGGDLTHFRYPAHSSSGGASPASAAVHHSQQQQQQHHHQLHQQAAAAAAAAAHQSSPYPRSMHAQMHYSTAYPANYYSPYPGEPMCYSPPAYQPYFPTKVYQSAPPPPPPPHHSAYRRYPYYQPGHPPPADLYEQAPPPPPAAGTAPPPSCPPPSQSGVPPPPQGGSQLVPAGPAAHTQHLEHYPAPPGYYPSYSPGGGGAGQCYTRSIQAPYMDYPPQCPCPMQQSCPKNVHTGPHIGSNSNSNSNSKNVNSSSSTSNSNSNNITAIINHCNNNNLNVALSHTNNRNISKIISNTSNNNSSNTSSNNLTMNVGNNNINSSSSSMNSNNSSSHALTTSRGPVKNVVSTSVTTNCTNNTQTPFVEKEARREAPKTLPLLSIAVKTEIAADDTDNKSQYEESVLTPLTPPESYTTNEDKLKDNLDKDAVTAIPLEEDIEEAIDKLQSNNPHQQLQQQRAGNTHLLAIATPIEAYDLTTTTPPLQNNTLQATATATTQSTRHAVGRRARIGKSMAWNMVYAGAASQQTPTLTAFSRLQITSPTNCNIPNSAQRPPLTAQNPPQHNNNKHVSGGSNITTSSSTPANVTNVTNNIITKQEMEEITTPLLLKAEIKAEKIKLEDELLDSVLQQHTSVSQLAPPSTQKHIIPDKNELKVIKAEPVTLSEVLNESKVKIENDCEVIKMIVSKEVETDIEEQNPNTTLNKPAGRMRLLPSRQQPLISTPVSLTAVNCDIDLSNASDEELLDLCHSPAVGSSSGKRIKILEFNKNQCKKSPPNSYKSLIKQAEPKTYLCLSRKIDKKSRFGKLHSSRSGKNNATNNSLRRRELILTDQQKQRLRLRKKKLAALEKTKREAKEVRRAEIKERRKQAKQPQAKSRDRPLNGKHNIDKTDEGEKPSVVNLIEEEDEEIKCKSQTGGLYTAPDYTNSTSMCGKLTKSMDNSPLTTPKPSPRRGKPTKKPSIPLHVIGTVDAVSRGYFSEPELRSANVLTLPISRKDIPKAKVEEEEARKPLVIKIQKKYKSTSEKRSKSETKKPIKSSALHANEDILNLHTLTRPVLDLSSHKDSVFKQTTSKMAEDGLIKQNQCELSTKDIPKEPKVSSKKLTISKKSRSNDSKSKKEGKTKKSLSHCNGKKSKSTKKSNDLESGEANVTDPIMVVIDDSRSLETLKPTNPESTCDIVETNNNEYNKVAIDKTVPSTSVAELRIEDTILSDYEEQLNDNTLSGGVEKSDKFTGQALSSSQSPLTLSENSATKEEMEQQHSSDTHSTTPVFLQPTIPPMPRVVCHSHHHQHVGKRNRSRSKFGSRKRQKLKHSTVSFELDETLPAIPRSDVVPKWNNGWTWEGEPFQGAVFLNSDDPLVIRTCYPAMRHLEGDIIRSRDCVLLKANDENELPYVAKVAHLWENPEDGEMMMSLLWYYRPEHTEQGRQPSDSSDEVYASRHRDHNSVACIEDKCYVLTFSEYCRYRRRVRAAEEDIEDVNIVPKRPNYYSIRIVPDNTNPELVMFCRRAYEFRTKRLLKMPNKQDYYVVTS